MKTNTYSHERGSIRLTLFLVIATIGCFWYGGQGLYTALKNRKPLHVAVDDLAKGRPTAHWLVLTNCELALSDAAYKSTRSKYAPASSARITEAFVPLRAPGQSLETPCYAVLATTDAKILGALEELRQVQDESGFKAWVEKHRSEIRQRRDVTGLVKFGIESGSESSKLQGLQQNLAKNYIILAEGKKPSWSTSLVLLLTGCLIIGGMVMSWRSNAEETTESV